MFKKQDPYSYTQYWTLSAGAVEIGVLAVEYQVSLYDDVQVLNQLSVKQPTNQQFLIHCTQRIFIKNPNNATVKPIPVASKSDEAFKDYPAMIETSMKIAASQGGLRLNLLDYSPQTVNTAVQQNNSQEKSDGTGMTTSSSSTTGSSLSQSSTYGTTVSLGVSQEGNVSGGATATYDHTTTATSDKSKTSGQESTVNRSSDASNSASMSIKDWGSYASVNPKYLYPTWVFGQEFPWNAIECRFASSATNPVNVDQVFIYISSTMESQLYDKKFLYPPSELSVFGLNFVMKACWRLYVDYSASTDITITHSIDYYSATHNLTGDNVNVYLDSSPAHLSVLSDPSDPKSVTDNPSVTLNLNILALDPLGVNSSAAIVGFMPSKFIPPATTSPSSSVALTQFKIISTTNDLLIEDSTVYPKGATSGFSVSQTCLTATWDATHEFAYQMTMFFKVTDSVTEHRLFLKHWKTTNTGVKLTIVINGDTTNPICKYVDALEAEGGENNLLSISLRNLDYASIDYRDTLQLGLNSIAISMGPIDDAWTNCVYQIRAISIE